ncbi:DUF317 domain-containing protein [Streptomyces sp. NPDC056178]|uniref:DUF317 domain-containing protein n=1 Tax=unclassified Streptomyces TaxID=2593676 RepID=UPI0035DB0452
MPETDPIDGDVYVSPRYLAGALCTGDPALAPLLDLGWDLQYDDLANVYVTAPDRRVRLGYLPEGEDDGLWRITAYRDPFAQPHWGVCFNDQAPTEFVTSFTTALAQLYTDGPDAYLYRPAKHDPSQSWFSAVVPLMQRGWQLQPRRWGVTEVQAPDGMAGLEFSAGPLAPETELTTLEARWLLRGGPEGWSRWYATASTHTPTELVTAITTAVSDPAPLPRWQQQMSGTLRCHAQLTPVTPPKPPTPTPLDVVRRNADRRPPSLGTVSVPRWSTSTQPATPAPTAPVSRPAPRR